jgi:hypothetical protein
MDSLMGFLGFVIAVSALITDELLTKVGLKLGYKELNPLFNFLRKKMEDKYAHGILTLTGSLLLLFLWLFFNDALLLMFFGIALNAPVMINALTLLRSVTQHTHDSHVEQP